MSKPTELNSQDINHMFLLDKKNVEIALHPFYFSQEQVKEKIESMWFYESMIRRKLLQKQKQWLLVKGILIPCIHIHLLHLWVKLIMIYAFTENDTFQFSGFADFTAQITLKK